MPVPVCRRARGGSAGRGRAFWGKCAAKRERFFGWRPHLVFTTSSVPVAFDLVPDGLHDLTPVHEPCYGLPAGATVYGDKGYNAGADEATMLAETGVRLVPLPQGEHAPQRLGGQAGAARVQQANRGALQSAGGDGCAAAAGTHYPGLQLKHHAAFLAVTIANAD